MSNCTKPRKTKYLTLGALVALVGLVAAGGVYASGKGDGYNCSSYGGPGYGRHGGGYGMMNSGMRESMMRFMDPDGSGKIDIKQVEARLNEQFAKHDANKDGKLSVDEFQTFWNEHTRIMAVRKFQRHDVDGKGYLTPEDLTNHVKQRLSWKDANGDGIIEQSEMRRGYGRHHKYEKYEKDDD